MKKVMWPVEYEATGKSAVKGGKEGKMHDKGNGG